jgi:hypothetical protein
MGNHGGQWNLEVKIVIGQVFANHYCGGDMWCESRSVLPYLPFLKSGLKIVLVMFQYASADPQ